MTSVRTSGGTARRREGYAFSVGALPRIQVGLLACPFPFPYGFIVFPVRLTEPCYNGVQGSVPFPHWSGSVGQQIKEKGAVVGCSVVYVTSRSFGPPSRPVKSRQNTIGGQPVTVGLF